MVTLINRLNTTLALKTHSDINFTNVLLNNIFDLYVSRCGEHLIRNDFNYTFTTPQGPLQQKTRMHLYM